ncbi:hypothetical protein RclHR1_34900001, partial [Rhizophagus clarus]
VINEFDSHRKNVIYDLQKIPGKVSFTADIWTSTLSSEAYLGLTIHYIDQNWVLQHFLLDITSFKTHHTGINMATEITKVLHEFKLVGKAMAITTDNESAMLVCGQKLAEEFEREMDDFSFNHYRCSAHILNLAVKQGMEIIDKEILDVRKLMAKIKNSVLLCDDLRELCIMEKLEYLRPEIDVETRWNSTYYMLCKLQQMETALKMLAIKHEGTFLPKENTTSSREYFHQLKKRRLGDQTSQVAEETTQTPASSSTDFAEIERYLALPCDENVEALLWWQAHSLEFPVLSLMAKDYLAIQSTSVACEQAFSVAGNTITKT